MSFFPDIKVEGYEENGPLVVTAERTLYVDVDETLVLSRWDNREWDEFAIKVVIGDTSFRVLPNWHHVEQIRQFKGRGMAVVVWSAGGPTWANAVVRALNIGKFVDVVIGKPDWYIDDKPVTEWIGSRFYLSPDGKKEV